MTSQVIKCRPQRRPTHNLIDKPLKARLIEGLDMSSDFSSEFLRGQKDCQDGTPHKPNQSEAYDRGYSCQYESEQLASELSLRTNGVSIYV